MAKLITISARLQNAAQFEGDIQEVAGDGRILSKLESLRLNVVPVTNVEVVEIKNYFDQQGDPDVKYPKFPFSIAGLTSDQLVALADVDVDHDQTMVIIETITIKDPI